MSETVIPWEQPYPEVQAMTKDNEKDMECSLICAGSPA